MNKKIGLLLWLCLPAVADMGAIKTSPVDLSEPAQRGVIAFNGSTELLLLSTDWQASTRTKVIRFIPFPSLPEVKLAPGSMEAVQRLVASHGLEYYVQLRSGPTKTIGIDLRFHARLGSHTLDTLEVTDSAAFLQWMQRRYQLTPDARVQANVAGYLERGIHYFVVDSLELTPERGTAEALLFRFATRQLYYPFMTSNLLDKMGEAELFFVTPEALSADLSCQDRGSPMTTFPVKLVANELRAIHPDFLKLFPDGGYFSARQYRPEKYLRDLRVTPQFSASDTEWYMKKFRIPPFFQLVRSGDRDGLKQVDFRGVDFQGRTALHVAAESGQVEMVRFLLGKGLSLTQASLSGDLPLHNAVRRQQLETARVLLGAGADANAWTTTPFSRLTPLHLAASLDDEKMCRLLLQAGADPSLLGEEDFTPVHSWEMTGDPQLKKLLAPTASPTP